MLSKLEILLYRDFLRISAGKIAEYYSPMERAFNLIFIPGLVWIIFLYYATKPFPKGLKYLFMIGFTAFGIVYGLYDPWITIAHTYFFISLVIPAFYFAVEMFISRGALKNLATHYSAMATRAYNEHANIEEEKHVLEQLSKTRKEIDAAYAMQRRAQTEHERQYYQHRIETLRNEEKNLMNQLNEIRRRRR